MEPTKNQPKKTDECCQGDLDCSGVVRHKRDSFYEWVFKWIEKYGFPTVAVVFLYFDFIRPLKDERNEFNATITSVMANQTVLIEELIDSQRVNAKNQSQILKDQDEIITSLKTLSETMRVHDALAQRRLDELERRKAEGERIKEELRRKIQSNEEC